MPEVEEQARSLVDLISQAHDQISAIPQDIPDDPNERAAAKLRKPYLGVLKRQADPDIEARRNLVASFVAPFAGPMAAPLLAGNDAAHGDYLPAIGMAGGGAARSGLKAVAPFVKQLMQKVGPKIQQVAKDHPKELATILTALGLGGSMAEAGSDETQQPQRAGEIKPVDQRLREYLDTPTAKKMLRHKDQDEQNKLIDKWRADFRKDYEADVGSAEGAREREYRTSQRHLQEYKDQPLSEKYPYASWAAPYVAQTVESAYAPAKLRKLLANMNAPEMQRWSEALKKVLAATEKGTAKPMREAAPSAAILRELTAKPPTQSLGQTAARIGVGAFPTATAPFMMALPQEIDLFTGTDKASEKAKERLNDPNFWLTRAGFGQLANTTGQSVGWMRPVKGAMKPPMGSSAGALKAYDQLLRELSEKAAKPKSLPPPAPAAVRSKPKTPRMTAKQAREGLLRTLGQDPDTQ